MVMAFGGRCPIGCAFYEDDYCIGCDLCLATTMEELIIAQEKLDRYLKLSPQEREDFLRENAYFSKE